MQFAQAITLICAIFLTSVIVTDAAVISATTPKCNAKIKDAQSQLNRIKSLGAKGSATVLYFNFASHATAEARQICCVTGTGIDSSTAGLTPRLVQAKDSIVKSFDSSKIPVSKEQLAQAEALMYFIGKDVDMIESCTKKDK